MDPSSLASRPLSITGPLPRRPLPFPHRRVAVRAGQEAGSTARGATCRTRMWSRIWPEEGSVRPDWRELTAVGVRRGGLAGQGRRWSSWGAELERLQDRWVASHLMSTTRRRAWDTGSGIRPTSPSALLPLFLLLKPRATISSPPPTPIIGYSSTQQGQRD